ncbi:MAG: sugar transferase [Patescibacteria group bacterium]
MLKGNKPEKIIILFGDIAILYFALLLALIIRYGSFPSQSLWSDHSFPFFFVNLVWIIIFYIAGLYDVEKSIYPAKIFYIIKTTAFGVVIAVLMFYFIPAFGITPKTNLFIDASMVSVFLWIWRIIYQKKITKGSKIKIFFFDNSRETTSFADFISNSPQLGYKIIGNIDSADLIIVPGKEKISTDSAKILYEMVLRGKTVVDFYRFYESTAGKIPVSLISEHWFLENVLELDKRKFEQTKRIIDAILAILFFIPLVILAPLVAIAIKINSSGPIFYRQKRVGKNGKIFEIIKFRSMTNNAERDGAKWAEKNDKRVTFVGNILRKTRIDELPQILNVLKGSLSFIGPRPERPEFISDLSEKIPHYKMRHIVKPGLSGWAQINFPYGSSVDDSMQKLQYDLYYIKNRSLVLEVIIILKTIMTVLRREGR